MNDQERQVRKFVYDTFVETSHPPLVQHIRDRFGLDRDQVVSILKSLEAHRQLTLIPGMDRIFMAHPFSAVITPFLARLRSGREYFINCSFDTLALHVSLHGAPMTISSFCHHTGQQIEISLDEGKVEWMHPDSAIVYLGLPATRWWENIVNTCGNMFLFFASHDALDEWLALAKPNDPGEALSIEQTLHVVQPAYEHKLKFDYERPQRDDMNRHFRKIGLTGPFWEF